MLNEKQIRFVEEYMQDYNATQAAVRTGYSEKTAKQQGSRLLTNADISSAIAKRIEKINSRLRMTREDVIDEISKIASFDVRNLYNDDGTLKNVQDLDDVTAAAIQSIDVEMVGRGRGADREMSILQKIKAANKLDALKEMGKHFNIYEDHQKSGQGEMHVHIEGKASKL